MTIPELAAPRLPWDAADPYPYYESLRDSGEVVWDDTAGGWLALSHAAARSVLGGSAWTSDPLASARTEATLDPVARDWTTRSMLFADGDNHRRLRGSVRDVFTPGFIAGLADGIAAIADAVVGFPPAGVELDLMAGVALPLPIAVVAEWLALDAETAQLLREMSPAIIATLGNLADDAERRAGMAAIAALMAEFLPLAADRRARPSDDLFSFIASDASLALEDVVTTTILIAVAGHETTANLLGAGLVRLLTPGADGTCLADRVDADDPRLLTELLRLDAPVQAAVRTATENTRIGAVDIEAGQSVFAVVAAANRDPAVYDSPARFDLNRPGPAPLSFGYGAHHCVGAALARLELTAALPRILNRRPRLAGPVRWRSTAAIRGPQHVPIVFGGP